MKNEIVNRESFEIQEHGQQFLEDLRRAWKPQKKVRQKTKLVDGVAKIVEEEVLVPSPVRRNNLGVPAKVFYHFAEMLKPEDLDQVNKAIQSGVFDVNRAITAFQAHTQAFDRKMKLATWEDALSVESASLSSLIVYKGEEKTVALVYLMLKKMAMKFGSRVKIQTEDDGGFDQLKELAEDIVTNYLTFRIADIRFVLRGLVVSGKKVFNLDYQTVMSAFDDAVADKLEYSSRIAEKEHSQMTANEKAKRERRVYEGKTFEAGEIAEAVKKVQEKFG